LGIFRYSDEKRKRQVLLPLSRLLRHPVFTKTGKKENAVARVLSVSRFGGVYTLFFA
jgi:hypothetical protein